MKFHIRMSGLKGFTEYEEEYTLLERLGKGKFGVVYRVRIILI